MKAQMVEQYESPKYPTAEQTTTDHTLLEKHLPPAWEKLLSAGAAGMLLLGTASGCDRTQSRPGPTTVKATVGGERGRQTSTSTSTSAPQGKILKVAPVFIHGDGSVVDGCVVVSPPVYVTEERAVQIIKEELKAVGIEPDGSSITMPEIKIPQPGSETPRKSHPLLVTLADSRHDIRFIYVTAKHYYEQGGPSAQSSVEHYKFRDVADYLASKIKEQATNGIYVVFYDPGANSRRSTTQKDSNQPEKNLRLQVQDFAKWVKEQKVVE